MADGQLINNLFVHTPAHLLGSRMPFLLNRKLQPEVACQEICIQDLDMQEVADCSARLAASHLATTLHAPFASFNPGSLKRRLQTRAHQVCKDSIMLAEVLGAHRIVFHPGLPYQAPAKVIDSWLQQALEFWPEYISLAARSNIVLCIENIYEQSSSLFVRLFSELGCAHFGHCFDVGHWNIYADQPLPEWFELLGRHIVHIHLHDNHGKQDQHLPLDSGNINFSQLFELIDGLEHTPSMTLEAHKLPDLEISLQRLYEKRPLLTL